MQTVKDILECKRMIKEIKGYEEWKYYICNTNNSLIKPLVNRLANFGRKHIKGFKYDIAFTYSKYSNSPTVLYNKDKIKHLKRYIAHLRDTEPMLYKIGEKEKFTSFANAHNIAFYDEVKSFINVGTGQRHKVSYKLKENIL